MNSRSIICTYFYMLSVTQVLNFSLKKSGNLITTITFEPYERTI
jgi:hypothetical protein